MKKAFTVPTSTNYNAMFGNLVGEKGVMAMVGSCIACVSCNSCTCACSCKAVNEFPDIWA